MDTRRRSGDESLRTLCLRLLYLNFFGNAWAIMSRSGHLDSVSYKQYLQDGFSVVLDLFLAVTGGLVFFLTISSIYCADEPSIRLLNAAFTFTLLDLFYIFYSVVQLNSGEDIRERFHRVVENAAEDQPIDERLAYQQSKESTYSFSILLMAVLMLITVAFKLYSALVMHCYKLELERNHVRRTPAPVRQNGNPIAVSLSTPPAHRAQPPAPQYPISPPRNLNERLNIPSNLPQQPPQYSEFPYDCSSVPLTLSNQCPSQTPQAPQAPQFPYQCPSIPIGFTSQVTSQPPGFPYNPATIPLSLPDRSASQPPQFPYQAPSILLDFISRSATQSLRFPYDSASIPLSLPNRDQPQRPQFPYQSPRIPFSFPGQSASQHLEQMQSQNSQSGASQQASAR